MRWRKLSTKTVHLTITTLAILALFLNHFSFSYSCLERHCKISGQITDLDQCYTVKGGLIIPARNIEIECVKYSFFPDSILQTHLAPSNNYRLVPDIFIILIYLTALYFLRAKKVA